VVTHRLQSGAGSGAGVLLNARIDGPQFPTRCLTDDPPDDLFFSPTVRSPLPSRNLKKVMQMDHTRHTIFFCWFRRHGVPRERQPYSLRHPCLGCAYSEAYPITMWHQLVFGASCMLGIPGAKGLSRLCRRHDTPTDNCVRPKASSTPSSTTFVASSDPHERPFPHPAEILKILLLSLATVTTLT
jgi:hypothetical protein